MEGGRVDGVSLGIWEFPSGNVLEVILTPADATGARQFQYQWQRGTPSEEDLAHYREVVKPEIYARAMEHTQKWGGIKVIGELEG